MNKIIPNKPCFFSKDFTNRPINLIRCYKLFKKLNLNLFNFYSGSLMNLSVRNNLYHIKYAPHIKVSLINQGFKSNVYLSALRNLAQNAQTLLNLYSNSPANHKFHLKKNSVPLFNIKRCKNLTETHELKNPKFLKSISYARNLEHLKLTLNKNISRSTQVSDVKPVNTYQYLKNASFKKLKSIIIEDLDHPMSEIHPICNLFTKNCPIQSKNSANTMDKNFKFKLFYYFDPRQDHTFNFNKFDTSSSRVTFLELNFHHLLGAIREAAGNFILSFSHLQTFKFSYFMVYGIDYFENSIQKLCTQPSVKNIALTVKFDCGFSGLINESSYLKILPKVESFSREIAFSNTNPRFNLKQEEFNKVIQSTSFLPSKLRKLSYNSALFGFDPKPSKLLTILEKFTSLTHLTLFPQLSNFYNLISVIDILKSICKIQNLEELIIHYHNPPRDQPNYDLLDATKEDIESLRPLTKLKKLKFFGWYSKSEQINIKLAFKKVFCAVEEFALYNKHGVDYDLFAYLGDKIKKAEYFYQYSLKYSNMMDLYKIFDSIKNLEYLNIVSVIDFTYYDKIKERRQRLLVAKPKLKCFDEWISYSPTIAWDQYFCSENLFGALA